MRRLHGRRRVLALLGGLLVAPRALAQAAGRPPPAAPFPAVVPGRVLRFPQDAGAHPEFRTEWWYVTGWLTRAAAGSLGFQITFFRTRLALADDNPSAFTPREILIAHAALSDPARGRLLHDQRMARAGFGLAGAGPDRTHAWIDDWSLEQQGLVYHARIPAREFALEFAFTATQPPLLQGDRGYSRKGPAPASASYYYSLPQLGVSGTLSYGGRTESITGSAWLDHEWSSSYLDQHATGWDWTGINLDDGGALMAIRMRDRQGGSFWAGGSRRTAGGAASAFSPEDIRFMPLREWRSPRTGTRYPVAWHITAGAEEFTLEPLMDDQEEDARRTTGTIYWEGAVRALRAGRPAGRGYLELTGYWRALTL